jgi:hypothetical protein
MTNANALVLARLSELEKAVKTANGSFVFTLLTQNLISCLERGDRYKEMATAFGTYPLMHRIASKPRTSGDNDAGSGGNGTDSSAGEDDGVEFE